MSSGNFATGQPSVPAARFALQKHESESPSAVTVRSAASRVTGNSETESKVPPDEGSLAMMHYALAEANAAQRASAVRQQDVRSEASLPMQQQIQQDQQQHQLGQQLGQPPQAPDTQPQHMLRRDVAFTLPTAPTAIDPSVETGQAEMVQLQNTLQILRDQTIAAQLKLAQVTAEREARIKRDRDAQEHRDEMARLAKVARVRLEKDIEEEQQKLMSMQHQTMQMAATPVELASDVVPSQLASGSSTVMVTVAPVAETALVSTEKAATPTKGSGVLPDGEFSPPNDPGSPTGSSNAGYKGDG